MVCQMVCELSASCGNHGMTTKRHTRETGILWKPASLKYIWYSRWFACSSSVAFEAVASLSGATEKAPRRLGVREKTVAVAMLREGRLWETIEQRAE